MIYSKQTDSCSPLTSNTILTPVSSKSYSAGYSAITIITSNLQNDIYATGQFVISTYIDGSITCSFENMHKTLKVVNRGDTLSNMGAIEIEGFPKYKSYIDGSSILRYLSFLVHLRVNDGGTKYTCICPAFISNEGLLSISLTQRVPFDSDYTLNIGDIIDISLPGIEYRCEEYTR